MKNLKDSKGFTLAEMLFCVLILSILAALIVTGSEAVKRSLTAMEEQYAANALAENLLTFITEEIRYSRDLTIETPEDTKNEAAGYRLAYKSDTYGENAVLKTDPAQEDTAYGRLILTYKDNTRKPYCPYESLYKNLWICPLDSETPIFRWDSDGQGILVSFGICDEDGEIKASMEGIRVRLLNGPSS
ncbi:MAG: prepilin-type N-terminal cleavage/methylation domain-containing protein [Hungatella sp.]|nr:prepilin-type N-terminal cleavage/methylation domain-containing protein [Hungatella sp.]